MAQAPTGYREIANTGQLMQGLIQPATAAIQDAGKDAGPQDNRAWRSVLLNALMIQEGGQLLEMGSRAKDQDGWIKAANALIDAGAAVQKAAQSRDVAALQTAASGLNGTCQGCHSIYRVRSGPKKQEPTKQQ